VTEEQWKPKRALDVRMRNVRGQLYLARGGDVYELEGVGPRVWQLSDGTRSLAEIAGALAEEFDVDTAEAEADVRRFADELVEANLLVRG
jgi:hypothetical protein